MGACGRRTFLSHVNSIIQGRYAVESPGEQLIFKPQLRECARVARYLRSGIGEAPLKTCSAGITEPLFDSYLRSDRRQPVGRLVRHHKPK